MLPRKFIGCLLIFCAMVVAAQEAKAQTGLGYYGYKVQIVNLTNVDITVCRLNWLSGTYEEFGIVKPQAQTPPDESWEVVRLPNTPVTWWKFKGHPSVPILYFVFNTPSPTFRISSSSSWAEQMASWQSEGYESSWEFTQQFNSGAIRIFYPPGQNPGVEFGGN